MVNTGGDHEKKNPNHFTYIVFECQQCCWPSTHTHARVACDAIRANRRSALAWPIENKLGKNSKSLRK